MGEIFRMQIRHMLGGRKKWLVLLFLVLPVLLTYLTMTFGGLGDAKRLDEQRRARQSAEDEQPPEEKWQRIEYDGKLIKLPSRLILTGEGLYRGGRRVSNGEHINIHTNRYEYRIENGEIFKRKRQDGHIDYFGPPWEMLGAMYLFFIYCLALDLLLALLYGSSLLGTELDNKTLTYLFTRPVPRWRVVAGKYLAIVLSLAPPLCISLIASWWFLDRPGGQPLILGLLIATIAGLLAYNALFAFIGFIVPGRAMVVALLYALVVEGPLSFVPALVNLLTINYYLRSLVWRISGLDAEVPEDAERMLERMVGGASTTTALLVLAGMTLLTLTLSSLLASRREYVV